MKIKRWEWKVSHCTLWSCSGILADVKHPPIYWGLDGIKSIKAQKTDLQQVQKINKIFLLYTDFQNMIFFSSDFWFSIFSDFSKIQKILFLLFFLSVPLFLLIHYKPLAIPKHKNNYNVYNIYINIQLHFTRQLLQAFQDLQPFRFCSRSDGKAEPAQNTIILYCNMHNSITILYAVNYAILTNRKNIKKNIKKSVDNSFNLCYY